jgi:hypothetical protein
MNTLSIHLRKVLIVGASTVAVMAAAAPAWADVFIVDFWGADGSIGADVFSGTLQSTHGSSSTYQLNGGGAITVTSSGDSITTPIASLSGDTVISIVDISAKPFLTGAPVGAPGPVPGAGLLSLAFLVLAGVKTKLREIAVFARQTRARSLSA